LPLAGLNFLRGNPNGIASDIKVVLEIRWGDGLSTIFVDECGYTGQNLLDAVQPIFALASLNLSELDCIDLKNNFFGRVKSVELTANYDQTCHR
jgi:hypothetical protein